MLRRDQKVSTCSDRAPVGNAVPINLRRENINCHFLIKVVTWSGNKHNAVGKQRYVGFARTHVQPTGRVV